MTLDVTSTALSFQKSFGSRHNGAITESPSYDTAIRASCCDSCITCLTCHTSGMLNKNKIKFSLMVPRFYMVGPRGLGASRDHFPELRFLASISGSSGFPMESKIRDGVHEEIKRRSVCWLAFIDWMMLDATTSVIMRNRRLRCMLRSTTRYWTLCALRVCKFTKQDLLFRREF